MQEAMFCFIHNNEIISTIICWVSVFMMHNTTVK